MSFEKLSHFFDKALSKTLYGKTPHVSDFKMMDVERTKCIEGKTNTMCNSADNNYENCTDIGIGIC